MSIAILVGFILNIIIGVVIAFALFIRYDAVAVELNALRCQIPSNKSDSRWLL